MCPNASRFMHTRNDASLTINTFSNHLLTVSLLIHFDHYFFQSERKAGNTI